MESFYDLPLVLLEGILIGAIGALFVASIKKMIQLGPPQVWLRMIIAGTVTGLLALISFPWMARLERRMSPERREGLAWR